MGLEVATYIADLVATNPLTSDAVAQGDDHLRLLKSTLQNTFPNMGGRLGRAQSVPNGYTVLAADNTVMLDVPAATGATTTHTISLPAISSITAGFYFDVNLSSTFDVVILAGTGGGTIEGAATYTAGPRAALRVFYAGSSAWRVQKVPQYFANGTGVFIDGSASISGGAHIGGDLSVSGVTRLLGSAVSISGAMFVTGNAAFAGAVTISGLAHFKSTVSMGGALTIATNLTVDGDVSISGTAVLSSELHVAGGASIGGVFVATGAATLASTLSVSGAAHFKSSLSVSGAAMVGGTLSVSGATVLADTLNVSGVTTINNAMTVNGTTTFAGIVSISGGAHFKSQVSISASMVLLGLLNLTGGQIQFPASQNASANANTLDDYEEGTWTPTLTFVTNGNFTVVYSTQSGTYTKIGRQVTITFNLVTSTFTHTTASGNLQITTLPFTPGATFIGTLNFQGITKANYTQYGTRISSATTTATLSASGSAQAGSSVTAADMPTGGTVVLQGVATYEV